MDVTNEYLTKIDPKSQFWSLDLAVGMTMDLLKNRKQCKGKIVRHRIEVTEKFSCNLYIQVKRTEDIKIVELKANEVKNNVTETSNIKINVHVISGEGYSKNLLN